MVTSCVIFNIMIGLMLTQTYLIMITQDSSSMFCCCISQNFSMNNTFHIIFTMYKTIKYCFYMKTISETKVLVIGQTTYVY